MEVVLIKTHSWLLQRRVSDDYCECGLEDTKDDVLSDSFKLFINHVLDPRTYPDCLGFYKKKTSVLLRDHLYSSLYSLCISCKHLKLLLLLNHARVKYGPILGCCYPTLV